MWKTNIGCQDLWLCEKHMAELRDAINEKLPKEKVKNTTYLDLYREFLQRTNIAEGSVDDYRPCSDETHIGIRIWLKDGSVITYQRLPDGK